MVDVIDYPFPIYLILEPKFLNIPAWHPAMNGACKRISVKLGPHLYI